MGHRHRFARVLLATASLLPFFALASKAAADDAPRQMEMVVVTAEKRPEALATIPASISHLTGSDLENQHVKSLQDVFARIPSASASDGRGSVAGSFPVLRGSGASDDSAGAEQSVVLVQDDLYYGTVMSYNPHYFDLDSIDVLRGPQGTTFGKNAVGGVIVVKSAAPSFDSSSEIALTYGNNNAVELTGYATGTLEDGLAGRLSASYRRSDGDYVNDLTGHRLEGEDLFSVRGQLLYDFSRDMSLKVIAGVSRNGRNGSAFPIAWDPTTFHPIVGAGVPLPPNGSPYHVSQSADGINRIDLYNVSADFEWTTPVGQLSNVLGYHGTDATVAFDFDMTGAPVLDGTQSHPSVTQHEHQWSEELRIASPESSETYVDYLAGLYYLDGLVFRHKEQFGSFTPGTFFYAGQIAFTGGNPSFDTISEQSIDDRVAAVYGEATVHPFRGDGFWDEFDVRVGARYAHEEKTGLTDHFGTPRTFTNQPVFVAPLSANFDSFTPKFTGEWKPSDRTVVYVSWAKGYKGGGFNQDVAVNPSVGCNIICATARSVAASQVPFKPEKNETLEAGIKTTFFDDRLSVWLTGYNSITRGLQVRVFDPALFAVHIANAGRASVQGVEFQSDAVISDQLRAGLVGSFTDAEFTDLNVAGCVACTGHQLPFAPKWYVSPYLNYAFPWTETHGSVELNAEYQFRSAFYSDIANTPYDRALTQRDHTFNVRASWTSDGGKWRVSLWANNLFNEHAIDTNTFGFAPFISAASSGNMTAIRYQTPQELGITVGLHWD